MPASFYTPILPVALRADAARWRSARAPLDRAPCGGVPYSLALLAMSSAASTYWIAASRVSSLAALGG